MAVNSEGVRLSLGEEAVLHGRVTDEIGAPIASFSILVEQAVGALERNVVTVSSAHDSEGNFEVVGLAAGTYLVTATAPVTFCGSEKFVTSTLCEGGSA